MVSVGTALGGYWAMGGMRDISGTYSAEFVAEIRLLSDWKAVDLIKHWYAVPAVWGRDV
jgi:hypothetical protein